MVRVYSQPGQFGTATLGGLFGDNPVGLHLVQYFPEYTLHKKTAKLNGLRAKKTELSVHYLLFFILDFHILLNYILWLIPFCK
jgi:hypothetical protein